jgi:hypothetical protein
VLGAARLLWLLGELVDVVLAHAHDDLFRDGAGLIGKMSRSREACSPTFDQRRWRARRKSFG